MSSPPLRAIIRIPMPPGAGTAIWISTIMALLSSSCPAITVLSIPMFPSSSVLPVQSGMTRYASSPLFPKWRNTCPLSPLKICALIPLWITCPPTASSRIAASVLLLISITTVDARKQFLTRSALTKTVPPVQCRASHASKRAG